MSQQTARTRYRPTPEQLERVVSKISAVSTFPYTDQDSITITKARIQLENGLQAIVNESTLLGQGFGVVQNAKGCDIVVEYLKAGAPMINGDICADDKTIVRSITVTGHEEELGEINKAIMIADAVEIRKEERKAAAEKQARYARLRSLEKGTPTSEPAKVTTDTPPPVVGAGAGEKKP